MATSLQLVVARYQEDIAWLEDFPEKALVVQKDVDVPNEGREPASFLWAMDKLYESDGRIAFVQGSPYAHCENLRELLDSSTDPFTWLGQKTFITEADGYPWHPGLPVRKRLQEWLGEAWSVPILFAAGGQFVIDAAQLRKWPREKYTDLRREMSKGENCWVMERLWERFLG